MVLYSKNAYVQMVNSKPSEDRFRLIHITVSTQTTMKTNKKVLIIKLSDENDPFFLYSLHMTEDDYQSRQASEGLVVDFSLFVERLVDLLSKCENHEKADNPMFQLCFRFNDYELSIPSLEVIFNTVVVVCLVSLRLKPGLDVDANKYLADNLVKLREEHAKLTKLYEQNKSELTAKLENAGKELTVKMSEIEQLKQRLKYEQDIEMERERARQDELASQQHYEKERKGTETCFNKELTLQEKSYQIDSLQYTLKSVKGELDEFIMYNEKHNNLLDLQIEEFQHDLRGKNDQIACLQKNLSSEQEQRLQLKEMLKEKQIDIKKKTTELAFIYEELRKVREQNWKLIKQLKLKSRIVAEQDREIVEKNAQLIDYFKNIKVNRIMSELKIKSSDSDQEMNKSQNANMINYNSKPLAEKYFSKDDSITTSNSLAASFRPIENRLHMSKEPTSGLVLGKSQLLYPRLSPMPTIQESTDISVILSSSPSQF